MSCANIYENTKGSITFYVSEATQQFVAHLVVKRTSAIVGKFSYPAREGYQTLAKSDNNYTGYLTAEMTSNISKETVIMEVKPFIDENTAPIGAVEIANIIDNTVKSINPVE